MTNFTLGGVGPAVTVKARWRAMDVEARKTTHVLPPVHISPSFDGVVIADSHVSKKIFHCVGSLVSAISNVLSSIRFRRVLSRG
jgi:hypothetical protein